jgi:hypothetical protein
MIKFFHSGMVGAPLWNNSAGTTVATLDACLVNGFNIQTASSVSVSSGVATATISAGQGYEVDSIVEVVGATPSELNGQKRVLSSTSTTVTFASTSPDGAATGTITLKYAPLGWSKPFSGTNQAAYRSADVTGAQMFLGLDTDSAATTALLRGYENMTAVATGTGAFPTTGQQTNWLWAKGASPSFTSPWIIFGDTKTFYILKQNVNAGNLASGSLYGFGDFVSYKAVDPHRCLIAAHTSTTNIASGGLGSGSTSTEFLHYVDPDTANNCIYTTRSASGVATPQSMILTLESYMGTVSTVVSGGTINPGGTGISTYPSPINQGLLLSRMVLAEQGYPRGHLRGLLGTPQNAHASFGQMDRVTGQGPFAGRKLMAIKCGAPAGTVSQGVVFFDLTGPWES